MDNDSLWNSLPVPALLLDEADNIAEVNSGAEQFLNLSSKHLVGEPMLDKVAIDANVDGALDKVRRFKGPIFINNVDVGSGVSAPVECSVQIAPVQGSDGALLVLIEPRKLSDKMGKAHGVRSAARSAIGMAEMLAHEIKNPLAGITGAAQLVSMNLSAEDQELTDLIVAESRRIVALLDQVEQFGNQRPPEKVEINVHDLLDRAQKSAAVGYGANMKIIEDFDPSLPTTYVDPDQMMQVFLNLLKNASEAAGPEGGTIRLRTFYDHALRRVKRDGTGGKLPLQVEIIDDGPGIKPDVAEQIFEPFVSGRENGTGLGLALVSKIISDHDGWISVDSVPGKTAFRISLPIAPPAQSPTTSPKE